MVKLYKASEVIEHPDWQTHEGYIIDIGRFQREHPTFNTIPESLFDQYVIGELYEYHIDRQEKHLSSISEKIRLVITALSVFCGLASLGLLHYRYWLWLLFVLCFWAEISRRVWGLKKTLKDEVLGHTHSHSDDEDSGHED